MGSIVSVRIFRRQRVKCFVILTHQATIIIIIAYGLLQAPSLYENSSVAMVGNM